MLLDVLLRYPTVTLLLLLALLAWRDSSHLKPARYAALLAMSIAALLLGTSYPGLELPTALHVIVRIADAPGIAFIWWFGLSLFDDDFELGAREWLGMTAVVVPVMYFRLADLSIVDSVPMVINIATLIVSLVLMAHLAYVTISGRDDDVIESRRRFRFFFLLALIVVTVLIVVSERVIDLRFSVQLSTFRVAAILPLALWATLWLMRFKTEQLSFETMSKLTPTAPKLDPRDHALHAELIRLMSNDAAYTEPGLTIRSLAEQLETPEHRLRALINKGMGYRNFSSFLNHYRIAAVKEAMQQADNMRTPILTLAMDVGFNSIATFNRAFLNEAGITPSEYRSQLLDDTDQN